MRKTANKIREKGRVVGEVVGVGVDLCEVERMRRTLERTAGFVDRVFTAGEQEYCRAANDPAERFAVRFAAKEAVLKAVGAGLGACRMRDIEIVRADSGAPAVVLHDSLAGLKNLWKLSLTHTATMAEAVVIAVGT